jgi:hypothetical protein
MGGWRKQDLVRLTKAELVDLVLELQEQVAGLQAEVAASFRSDSLQGKPDRGYEGNSGPVQGQRIIFEFLVSPQSQPRAWGQVVNLLGSAGGAVLDTPAGEPPYLIRAVVPLDVDVSDLLRRLRELDGVGRADPDALRVAF